MPHTLAQKILQAHTDEEVREAGQIVNCHLSGVLANDITGPLAIKSFRAMGAAKVFDKDCVFLVMDHFTPQKDIDSANQVMVTRKFAQEMGVTHYYEGGDCGVEHALLPEQGLVKPGDLVIGADSHTCTYGGLGSTDVAAGMALGRLWFKVPPTIRVEFEGKMPKWLRGKDLILRLIGDIGVDGALYKALEFGGETLSELDVEARLCISNMAIEAGGKCGLFPSDEKTLAYCRDHNSPDAKLIAADAGCEQHGAAGVLPAPARKHEARFRSEGRDRQSGGHRLLHQRTHFRHARRRRSAQGPQGRQGCALHRPARDAHHLASGHEGRAFRHL